MARDSLSREAVLSRLKDTPGRLATITANSSESKLKSSPEPGEWPATGVLAHLRACADVWGDAIATILRQDRSTLRAINPRLWIKRTGYAELAFGPSLAAFTAQRAELLRILDALPDAAWSLSITVTGAGSPLVRTVHSYAERLARHESAHIKQIERLVSSLQS